MNKLFIFSLIILTAVAQTARGEKGLCEFSLTVRKCNIQTQECTDLFNQSIYKAEELQYVDIEWLSHVFETDESNNYLAASAAIDTADGDLTMVGLVELVRQRSAITKSTVRRYATIAVQYITPGDFESRKFVIELGNEDKFPLSLQGPTQYHDRFKRNGYEYQVSLENITATFEE